MKEEIKVNSWAEFYREINRPRFNPAILPYVKGLTLIDTGIELLNEAYNKGEDIEFEVCACLCSSFAYIED